LLLGHGGRKKGERPRVFELAARGREGCSKSQETA